uniref:Uncharacterized protein n=1 Tax=Arundo donax TaxID=35708 RepID=A0A0A8YID0_ARUDO
MIYVFLNFYDSILSNIALAEMDCDSHNRSNALLGNV